MRKVIYQRKFKQDIKKIKKRGSDLEKLKAVICLLIRDEILPQNNHNHKLCGEFKGYWECHIAPNWLLMYKKAADELILARTGSHSDLF